MPAPVSATPPPPLPPDPLSPPEAPAPVAPGAGAKGRWPLPDRHVTFGGTTLPLELVVVAALHFVAAGWFLVAASDVFAVAPDFFVGVFRGGSLDFLLGWTGLAAVALLAVVVVGLFATALLLVQRDRLGRALAAVVTGLLLLGSGDLGGQGVLILVVSAGCTAVLFLSPWCRAAFLDSDRTDGRPSLVVLSVTLGLVVFGLFALVALLMLPGVRFLGDLGATFLVATVCVASGTALGLLGLLRLRRGPDPEARFRLTAGAVLLLVGLVLPGRGQSYAQLLLVLLVVVVPLWVAPSVRAWFGEKPLQPSS